MTPIIEKIQKLRALSTSSNANEAAIAAAMADKLIAKHRISEEEISLADPSKKDLPIEGDDAIYESGRITMWKHSLAMRLAQNYGCAVWNDCYNGQSDRKVSRYRLVGVKSDIDIAMYMFSWLTSEVERLCKLHCKGKGKVFSSSYCDGAIVGIKVQLDLAAEQSRKQANQDGQSAALVRLDNRLNEAKTALYQFHKNLRAAKTVSHRQFNSSAYDKGIQDGKNIQITKGLNSTVAGQFS